MLTLTALKDPRLAALAPFMAQLAGAGYDPSVNPSLGSLVAGRAQPQGKVTAATLAQLPGGDIANGAARQATRLPTAPEANAPRSPGVGIRQAGALGDLALGN